MLVEHERKAKSVNALASPKMKRVIELASEIGASSWLTVVPVSEMDLIYFKQAGVQRCIKVQI